MNSYEKYDDVESLKMINESLSSMYSILSYQKEEIVKTESIINRMQKCLINQNKALKMFVDEIEILEKEKNLCLQFMNSKGISCEYSNNNDVIRSEDSNGLSFVDVESDRSSEGTVLKRKNSESIDSDEDISVKIVIRSDDYDVDKSYAALSRSTDDIPIRRMKIPQLLNKTISKMLLINGFIIGGSGGMLLKYTDYHTHIYDTGTTDDITHIEISTHLNKAAVVAFTEKHIFIFNFDGRRPYSVVDLLALNISDIESVANNGSLVYMALSNGHIKILDRDGTISDHSDNGHSGIRSFFPSTIPCKYILVTLQDSMLYKTSSDKDLNHLEVIEGPTNVKMVLRVNRKNFICYSDDTIWLLNSECEVVETLNFKYGIKFVERDAVSVAVADWNNSVHLHSLKLGSFGWEMYVKDISVSVTALAINTYHVYVAAGDAILVIKYEF